MDSNEHSRLVIVSWVNGSSSGDMDVTDGSFLLTQEIELGICALCCDL
jgi:hypothetical protein